ncbi:hypothetical protein [Maribacter sp. ACAM166]|uniref:hypothetical protein n=1 Tax=Maribacter sp. ACAM166 TaxID=2508996 RepID=UPI0020178639|nr:hypothetical protein [Maribacter sp. ACAM166]
MNYINGIALGSHTVIGAGALIIEDFGDKVIAYGSPAKVIRNRTIGEPYLYSSKNQQPSL